MQRLQKLISAEKYILVFSIGGIYNKNIHLFNKEITYEKPII